MIKTTIYNICSNNIDLIGGKQITLDPCFAINLNTLSSEDWKIATKQIHSYMQLLWYNKFYLQSYQTSQRAIDAMYHNWLILMQYMSNSKDQNTIDIKTWLLRYEKDLMLDIFISNQISNANEFQLLNAIPYTCLIPLENFLPACLMKNTDIYDSKFIKLLPKPFCNCEDCMREYHWYLILFITLSTYHASYFIDQYKSFIPDFKLILSTLTINMFMKMILLSQNLAETCIRNTLQNHITLTLNIELGNIKSLTLGNLISIETYLQFAKQILNNEDNTIQDLTLYFQKQQDLFIEFQNTQLVSNKQINEIEKLVDQQKDNQANLTPQDITKILSKINEY